MLKELFQTRGTGDILLADTCLCKDIHDVPDPSTFYLPSIVSLHFHILLFKWTSKNFLSNEVFLNGLDKSSSRAFKEYFFSDRIK